MTLRSHFLLISCIGLLAWEKTQGATADSSPTELDPVVVTGQLDRARAALVPDLGATAFAISEAQIANLPQGENTPFDQVLLQAPGVAEDSSANGAVHVRGEHANLQYRINGILLPEGISGFGAELDPRFVSTLQLITGSLPAQYGFRTSGVVDITTKGTDTAPGGSLSLYTGSHATVKPSAEVTGKVGSWDTFADTSVEHNALGIEAPTAYPNTLHDETTQIKAFGYASRLLTESSRVSLMASESSSVFQVPDTPGLPAGTSPDGSPWIPGSFDSSHLNETQREQNAYAVGAYQRTAPDLDLQASAFVRGSRVHFVPDPTGDLAFNGVASDVERTLGSVGAEADASIPMGSRSTVRVGASYLLESVDAATRSTVFPVDPDGNPTGGAETLSQRQALHGVFAGAYLQDEWRVSDALTVNAGLRIDQFHASFDSEGQASPRLNVIYQPTDATSLHAGYSRYFTPPPVESVTSATVALFQGTSNAPAVSADDPVRSERAHYIDVGVSQRLTPSLSLGVDGYAKRATNQLDDGLFGQTLILSAFNYARGEISGVEVTASYVHGGFSSYLNAAENTGTGKDIISAQFLFDPTTLATIERRAIYLDHDQKITASAGAAYVTRVSRGDLRLTADAVFGTGLRTDAVAPDGSVIPNGGTVPSHLVINVGLERTLVLSAHRRLSFRLEVSNLLDTSYELRDGTGVGVNAAQYGARRGLYATEGFQF